PLHCLNHNYPLTHPTSNHSLTFSTPLPPSQPSSSLFPYTTLFRSHSELEAIKNGASPFGSECGRKRKPKAGHHEPSDEGVVLDGDRKSTRLNSSHGSISYAVFCLKKKKEPYIHIART